MTAARLPTDFVDSHGVHPVGRALMIRLSRRRLGVTNARGTIGFDRARTISRRSVGLMLDGIHSFGVALWIGTT